MNSIKSILSGIGSGLYLIVPILIYAFFSSFIAIGAGVRLSELQTYVIFIIWVIPIFLVIYMLIRLFVERDKVQLVTAFFKYIIVSLSISAYFIISTTILGLAGGDGEPSGFYNKTKGLAWILALIPTIQIPLGLILFFSVLRTIDSQTLSQK